MRFEFYLMVVIELLLIGWGEAASNYPLVMLYFRRKKVTGRGDFYPSLSIGGLF